MRIKLNLEALSLQKLNLNYNYYLSSFVYNKLEEYNQSYARFLHDEGYKLNNKRYKLFTFSQLFPERYSIEGADLIFEGVVKWYVSSPVNEFLVYFINSLMYTKVIKIGNNELNVESVEITIEPKYAEEMHFKCLSPVTIATSEPNDEGEYIKRDLNIWESKYKENIRNNICAKYEAVYSQRYRDEDIEISFIDVEKHKRGKLINYKDGIKIKGYMAPIKLSGNIELIKIAYECGVGDRNSLGFGMLEVERR